MKKPMPMPKREMPDKEHMMPDHHKMPAKGPMRKGK